MPVITLTTDFGTADPFVGLMKGVILSIAPDATLVDLSHEVAPQDVVAGALVLESALGYFPDGTIHLGVVDPGVGGERLPIAVRTRRYIFIGPDNGLFSAVISRDELVEAVALTKDKFHLATVSDTFQGRDIFAPVAANLHQGAKLKQMGEPVEPRRLQLPEPWQVGNDLELHIVQVDRFGNLITDLTEARFDEWLGQTPREQVALDVNDITIHGVVNTYSDRHEHRPLAYIGSLGRMEIAIRDGRAADELGADQDTVIRLARQA